MELRPRQPAARVRAFGRGDQLQQLLGIVQPLLELRSQGLGCDLGGDTHVAGQRIGRHKLHFIDPDGAAIFVRAQSFFNLSRYILCLRSPDRERAHQTNEVFLSHVFGEVQAGESGGIQQRGETALGVPRFQRNPIQQQLVVGHAQQEALVPGGGQTLLQFFPGNFELRLGALVPIAIHPGVLDQDVQAVHKRPCGGGTRTLRCVCGRDRKLLGNARLKLKGKAKR